MGCIYCNNGYPNLVGIDDTWVSEFWEGTNKQSSAKRMLTDKRREVGLTIAITMPYGLELWVCGLDETDAMGDPDEMETTVVTFPANFCPWCGQRLEDER